jgi:hypothetical protein
MVNWARVAAVLFVVGLVMTLTFGYDNRSVVVDHGTFTFEEGSVLMGPYDPGPYDWQVWVEDYYPGFDEGDEFDVYAQDDPSDGRHYSVYPYRYVVRNVDGVRYEHYHDWSPWMWADDDVYFGVEAHEETQRGMDDTVDVIVVRTGGILILPFAAGLITMLVGLFVIVLLKWSSKRND